MFSSNQNQQGLNIPCHNLVKDYVNIVYNSLINEISNKANDSQISNYCSSILAQNNYNNQTFFDLLKVTLDLFAYYLLINRYNNPNKCFQESIINSYLYFISLKTLETRELNQICDQETLNLCKTNAQTIVYELKEFDKISNNQPINVFNNNQNVGFNNQPSQLFSTRQNNNQLFNNRNFDYGDNQSFNQVPINRPVVVSENNQYNPPSQIVHTPIIDSQKINYNSNEITTEHYWSASEIQKYKTLVNRRTETEKYVISNSGIILQEILPKQERIMDLEKHKILGNSLTFNTPRTYLNVKDKAEELGKISSSEINQNTTSINSKIMNYIWYQQIIGSSIEGIIFEGRLIKEKNQDNTSSIYRCFCLIGKPTVGKSEYIGLFNSLKSNNFEEVSNKLKNIINSNFKQFVNDTNFKLLCLKIDNYIKNLINDFIKYGLVLDKLRLDNFSDDISQLETILSEKLGEEYFRAYVEFEKETIKNLFLNSDTDKISFESDNVEGIEIICLPTGCSVTYIDLTDKELDIRIIENSPYKIDNISHKLLYEIADSLFKQKNGIIYEVLTDYLVTADDVIYRLYMSYLENEVYFLIR